MDTSYRQEFKDLFEANFGRVRAELGAMRSEVQGSIGSLRSEMLGRMEALEARVDAKLDRLETRLIRWMFVFWVGTIGTVLAIVRL